MTLSSVALASTAETLQPASVQTIDDELVVNNVARFNSIYVGSQGEGGVTAFNGTVINNTTDDDGNSVPVTVGDDLRVDGRIYRGATAGTSDDMPFIINDNAQVTGTLTVAGLSGTGIVSSANLLDGTIATADIADNAVTSAKIADSSVATADIADGAVTTAKIATDSITTDKLDFSSNGLVKAGGWVNGNDLTFMNDNYFNPLGGEMEITRQEGQPVGAYLIDMGFDVSESYFYANNLANCGVSGAPIGTLFGDAYNNFIMVNTFNAETETYIDCNFQFLVF